jgi:hypothetical protein
VYSFSRLKFRSVKIIVFHIWRGGVAKQKTMVNVIAYVLKNGWRLVSPDWKTNFMLSDTNSIQLIATLNLQIVTVVFAN